MEFEQSFLLTSGIEASCRTSEERLKWQLSRCIERVVQTMPGTFSELESLLVAKDDFHIILWLTKNMFIVNDGMDQTFVCVTKRFPKPLYNICMASFPHDKEASLGLDLYSRSSSDVLWFLEQLGNYQDFTPHFHHLGSTIASGCFVSTCFLENILQDAQTEIEFHYLTFNSPGQGYAFPKFGCNVHVSFFACQFINGAADAFFKEWFQSQIGMLDWLVWRLAEGWLSPKKCSLLCFIWTCWILTS